MVCYTQVKPRQQLPHMEAPCISLFLQRNNPGAAKFQLRKSNKKGSELTTTARANLIAEHGCVSSTDRDGEVKQLLSHYGVSTSAFVKMKRKWMERGDTSSSLRSGRPALWDDVAAAQLREANKANRKAKPKHIKALVTGSSGGGRYSGSKKDHMSTETIRKRKKEIGYVGKGTKVRPVVTENVAAERVICCTKLLAVSHLEAQRVKVDEKIFALPGLSGALDHHPDSDSDEEQVYKPLGHKRHPPQIMVIAGVAKPVLRANWTTEEDKWEKTGKVFLVRCERYLPAERGRRLRDNEGNIMLGPCGPRGGKGKELYEFEAGTFIPVDLLDRGTGGMYKVKITYQN